MKKRLDAKVEKAQKCKLILDTPYTNVETDSYIAFLKIGDEKMVEANNVDIEDIEEYIYVLTRIVRENRKEIVGNSRKKNMI